MNLRDAVEMASQVIARRDAETLLLHVAGRNRAWLMAHPEAELTRDQIDALQDLAARRAANEPLQYLTGHQEFLGLDFHVTPDVLIPRPETELLVEAVLGWLQQTQSRTALSSCVVDVGTGSGAIAVALAAGLPSAEIWALDLSPAALKVAQENAERLQVSTRIRFCSSDLLQSFLEGTAGRKADAVVANPPYVPVADAETMQPEVRDYEPHLALFAGVDGLDVYRRLIPQASSALREGGLLALEFGYGQRPALEELLKEWDAVQFMDDYAGIPRVALALRPGRGA